MATSGPDHQADGLAARADARDVHRGPTILLGWALAPTPVVERSHAHRPIALADLHDDEDLGSLLRFVGSRERSAARAGGTILGHAISAFVSVCLAPFAIDGAVVEVDPEHFGFDLADNGDARAMWVSRPALRLTTGRSAREHGNLAARLLLPIATAIRVTARIGDRGSDLAIVDRLNGTARQLERSPRCAAEAGWVEEFIDGLGIGNPLSIRTLAVQPDDGPPIALPVARVCCVGARRPAAELCPTCPVFGDDTIRVQRAREWLRSLDDQAFSRFVGRQRM